MDLPLSERERAIIALQVWGELPRRGTRYQDYDDYDEGEEDDDGQEDTV